jgi:hypothetical protein
VTSFFSNDENKCMNNKCNINTKIKNKKDCRIIPKVLETRFNSTFIKSSNTKEESNINNIIKKLNKNKDNLQKKEKKKIITENFGKLIEKIKILVNYYIRKYFDILLKYNTSENNKNENDNIKIDIKEIANDTTNNKKKFSQDNKKKELDLNHLAIEKNRQKLKIPNSFDLPDHKKSNSIIVNKMISSNTSSCKELPKNFRKNNNLSFLLTNKLKFFSKDKESNNNINDTRESELYRDSQSLQKKYEQICRRKKEQE